MGNTGLTRLWESSESSIISAGDENNEGRKEMIMKGDETSSTASTGSTEYRYKLKLF